MVVRIRRALDTGVLSIEHAHLIDETTVKLMAEKGAWLSMQPRVLQEGTWADMLLVNGDPTQDIHVLNDYERNFAVIIKDGKVYKSALD